MIDTAFIVLTYIAFLAFSARRLMTYLHIFQQEEYDEPRFLGWVLTKKAFDKRLSFVILLTAALSFGLKWMEDIPQILPAFFVFLGFAITVSRENDPRKNSKKKLTMTARAMRVYFTALVFAALSGIWVFFTQEPLFWLGPVQLMPAFLIMGNMTMMPIESVIQAGYWNEAQAKLKTINPTVIGVTGSYGKTSVKHILGHILKTAAPTMITPGSVNTPMGIARIIREDLEENTEYFIVEMGAYGPGSIERLCKLTPPDIGIITAIGHAHFERFKSLDTVARTKFELAKAVIQNEGRIIAHDKVFMQPYAKAVFDTYPDSFIICGEKTDNTLVIENTTQTDKGIEVRIRYNGALSVLNVPLYGLHHGVNVALSFAAARALDIPADKIATALKTVPQIPHRLEVKKQPGGGMLIDDAYNANPLGFRAALDLLAVIHPKKRKVLITPGMVELGATHDDLHEKLGMYAGEVCDVAIVINGKRIPSFIKGFKEKGGGKTLQEVKTFKDAQDWLQKNKQDSDVILIENDLPDLYESVPKI